MHPVDTAMIEFVERALGDVLKELNNRRSASSKLQAIFSLTLHAASTWKAMSILMNQSEGQSLREAVSNPITILLRSFYDAYLQAAYIVQDPAEAELRARNYLDFEYVERMKHMNLALSGTSALSKRIANSTKREAGEAHIRAKFEEVKDRYSRGEGKPGTRNQWYDGSLHDLAKRTGRDDEYRWYFTFSNSSVHAGPLAVKWGPQAPVRGDLVWVLVPLGLQMVKLARDSCGLSLNAEVDHAISEFSGDIVRSEPKSRTSNSRHNSATHD
jgi:hypothetical protein